MDEWRKRYNLLDPDQRKYIADTAEAMLDTASKRFMHNWRQTLMVLVFPGLMAVYAVIDPESAGRVISDLWNFFSFVLVVGIFLTTYRGIRLHSRFSLLMSSSMVLALAMLVPFVFFLEITARWMAVVVLYNTFLAFYVIVATSIYLLMMGIAPPREPYA